MILAEGLLIALVAGLVTGGSIARLAQIRLNYEAVFILAFVVQSVAPLVLRSQSFRPDILLYGAWMIPTLLCAAVAAVNGRRPGMWVLALGLVLNLVVVGANAGMPVSVQVAADLGMEAGAFRAALETSWLHVPVHAGTMLAFLGDVIPVPGPDWHKAIVSLGDVLIAGGAALFLFTSLHPASKDSSS